MTSFFFYFFLSCSLIIIFLSLVTIVAILKNWSNIMICFFFLLHLSRLATSLIYILNWLCFYSYFWTLLPRHPPHPLVDNRLTLLNLAHINSYPLTPITQPMFATNSLSLSFSLRRHFVCTYVRYVRMPLTSILVVLFRILLLNI